jgi:hypothetical protein
MENKSIILNLPSELIDKIDQLNKMDNRSTFIKKLLEEQLQSLHSDSMDETTEIITTMSQDPSSNTGEIDLVNSNGVSLGKFDIDTLEGFENMAKRIQEASRDPAVQIRARSFF